MKHMKQEDTYTYVLTGTTSEVEYVRHLLDVVIQELITSGLKVLLT